MIKRELSGNNLLDALKPDDKMMVGQVIEEIRLETGHIIHEPGDDVRYAYFPREQAVTSYHVIMADGAAVETAIVGREGAVGGIVSHGRLPAFARCCAMHGGDFYRMPLAELELIKKDSVHMRYLFARYADCLVAQIFQSVACNATHTIEQRTAKWLMAAMTRTGQQRIAMKQDQLGSLLGVGRSYVSRVVHRMKAAGMIAVQRGTILILDRDQIAGASCECNKLVSDHFRIVLRGVYPEESGGVSLIA